MLGFWTQIIMRLLRLVLDAIKWDIGNASLKGELPGTVIILTGALVGSLVAGFAGAVLGGLVAVVLMKVSTGDEAACVR